MITWKYKDCSIVMLLVFQMFLSTDAKSQTSRRDFRKSSAYNGNYQRMASGPTSNNSFEIRNGTLWAAGRDVEGQLGNGAPNTNSSTFVQTGANLDTWVCVSSGETHTLAIKSDGTLWAWGKDNFGQLGDNISLVDKSGPVQVGTANDWISVAAGQFHSLALKANGTLYAWGNNGNGRLGTNGTTNSPTPILVPIPAGVMPAGVTGYWTAISAGQEHSIGIIAGGYLMAWGRNQLHQIGDGTNTSDVLTPKRIASSSVRWTSISAGANHNVAIKADGGAYTWGDNLAGQCGATSNTPTLVSATGASVCAVAAGTLHSMILRSDGTLWVSGSNTSGQLGFASASITVFTVIPGTNDWVSIAAGSAHSMALRSNGELNIWGNNLNGQVANGLAPANRTTPAAINTELHSWLDLSEGNGYSLALKSNGTIYGWGSNGSGSAGNVGFGATVPTQNGTDQDWIAIETTFTSSFGIKSGGTLWGWGENFSGELGNGTYNQSFAPVAVSGGTRWTSVKGGWEHTIAIKTTGEVFSWGSNYTGQAGIPQSIGSIFNTPQLVNISDVVSIAAGFEHSIALKSDGSIWSWGSNAYGQLGNSTAVGSFTDVPVRVLLSAQRDNNWVAIMADGYHTLGLQADGTVWAWGWNLYGQLGVNAPTNSSVPIQITGLSNVIGLAAGNTSSHVLLADGTIKAFGGNNTGQLGDGTTINKSTPTLISGVNNITSIESSQWVTQLLRSNKTKFCATGYNSFGEIGNGTTTQINSFDCVGTLAAAPMEDDSENDSEKLETAVNNLSNESFNLHFYPNPFTDDASLIHNAVNNNGAKLTITDISGKMIASKNVMANTQYSINAICNNLQNGIYFIQAETTSGESTVFRILKK